MNTRYVNRQGIASDLQQVVEPLASYICATERPMTALNSALSVLFREVVATNKAAITQFRNLIESHRA